MLRHVHSVDGIKESYLNARTTRSRSKPAMQNLIHATSLICSPGLFLCMRNLHLSTRTRCIQTAPFHPSATALPSAGRVYHFRTLGPTALQRRQHVRKSILQLQRRGCTSERARGSEVRLDHRAGKCSDIRGTRKYCVVWNIIMWLLGGRCCWGLGEGRTYLCLSLPGKGRCCWRWGWLWWFGG